MSFCCCTQLTIEWNEAVMSKLRALIWCDNLYSWFDGNIESSDSPFGQLFSRDLCCSTRKDELKVWPSLDFLFFNYIAAFNLNIKKRLAIVSRLIKIFVSILVCLSFYFRYFLFWAHRILIFITSAELLDDMPTLFCYCFYYSLVR